MGTHPIFESDFDCLTESESMLSRGVTRFAPRVVSSRLAHTDKHMPDLAYYRRKPAETNGMHFIDAQLEQKHLDKAHYYTFNSMILGSGAWMAANMVCQFVNVKSNQRCPRSRQC